MSGFETALNEITLVLFTTLAPTGAAASACLAAILLVSDRDETAKPWRSSLKKYFFIPVVVTMLGLVASSTHLGSPENALFVFTGVGRSPLSNEVAAAVLFLLLAGLYWLYTFSEKPSRTLQNTWLVFIIASSVALIIAIGCAYNARTVPTWNTPFSLLGICANALMAGPPLALFVLFIAKCPSLLWVNLKKKALRWVSAPALIGNLVIYTWQGQSLATLSNVWARFTERVPNYWLSVVFFAIVAFLGLAVLYYAGHEDSSTVTQLSNRNTTLILLCIALVLLFISIFVARFVFYMMHMTG